MIGLGVRWAELRQSIQLDLAEIDRLARAQWSGMSGATDALADLAGMADTLSSSTPGCWRSPRSRDCGWRGPGTTG